MLYNGCIYSVYGIATYAFRGYSSLTSVEIPNSVTYIGEAAFEGCSSIVSIKSFISADNLFIPADYVFGEIDKDICTLYVPASAKNTYVSTDGWKDFLNIIEMNTEFTIRYVIDGDIYDCYTLEYGESIPLSDTPVKENYVFSGWSDIPSTMPAEDVVIEGTFVLEDTAVEMVKDESGNIKDIYDLSGRKMNNPTKGINIIDGKLVYMK